jgi:hypothetical protein
MITREIINPNISFIDYKDGEIYRYTFEHLNRLIDSYKNLLVSKGAKKGMSIVIGTQASTVQTALVIACAELGITIVINDNPLPANKKYVAGIINPKLKSMLPIDYFILEHKGQTDKFVVYNDVCRSTILINDEKLDHTPNTTLWADESTTLIKCTSSGTTGTPKVLTHTHGFMSKLIERNSKQFYGNMGMISNLAHGSSAAVYFLPGLVSDKTIQYVNLPNVPLIQIAEILKEHSLSLDHLLVPYTAIVDDFFNSTETLPDCIIHTLGMIRKFWVEEVKKGRAKDIISIFGTNETSGPFMINQATDDDFAENTYKMLDDFYKVVLNKDNDLEVTVPVYNTIVRTHDTFLQRGNKFVHVGRSNLYRINDLEIDTGKYQSEIDKLLKAELVIDTQKDNIYLAIWDEYFDIHRVRHIDNMMRNDSNGLHFITKYDSLKYSDYLNGIKIDKEMLREYFRNM